MILPAVRPSDASVVVASVASVTLPVPVATASGSKVAPVPMMLAAAGAPTSGLAVKPSGLSRLDPGTFVLLVAVVGLLARLAWYWIWLVGCAGMKLVLNCSTWGTQIGRASCRERV